jgi:hypothetical protein
VARAREEIRAAIERHPVVVVAGETGSGKTTQLPKICLELGRGRRRRIGHTQPRRLAARTVAQRIAEELATAPRRTRGLPGALSRAGWRGDGRQADDRRHPAGEMARDRDLRQYDTLIIDEAHERSLNIDFILGYLKRLLPGATTSRSSSPARRSTRSASRDTLVMRRSSGSAVAATRCRRTTCWRPGRWSKSRCRWSKRPCTACDAATGANPATCWFSCPGSATSATWRDACARRRPSTCCRSMPASARRNRRACSAAARGAACVWCWPPTSPRRRSRCRAFATSSTRAWRA